jgi:hypothetical protein
VGVVGHRPNRLKYADLKRLEEVLGIILNGIKDETLAVKRDQGLLFDTAAPSIRAITPLAEGTDRIFAEQALAAGFELCCITPFPVSEYEADFAPPKTLEENSLDRFRGLLEKATTRFALDGTRAEESAAYGAGGEVVLNQSDILIVVWDGDRQKLRGGTEETFDSARRRGTPVVWIDAHSPHAWQLLDAQTPLPAVPEGQRVTPNGAGNVPGLRTWVRDVLELPKLPKGQSPHDHEAAHRREDERKRALQQFYKEHRPRWTLAVMWKAFQQFVGDAKRPSVSLGVAEFEQAIEDEWPRDRSTPLAQLIDSLRKYYAWSDKLAVLYADRYRSAFLLMFMLAAVAVGLALLPVGVPFLSHHWANKACNALELISILAVLVVVHVGRRKRWHERFLDYRLTAELVRHLRIVAPLGGRWPIPQIPAHWATYGQPGATWMAWYVRAVERAIGLPSAVVDRFYLEGYLAELSRIVGGQIDFHWKTMRRCQEMEKRLHRIADALLILTIAACALHLLIHFWPRETPPKGIEASPFVFVCGFFPALGAALAAIMNQAEFRRLANRSKAMAEQMPLLLADITNLRHSIANGPAAGARPPFAHAVSLASAIAGLFVAEVLDWRVVLLDRPLEP